MGRTNDKKIAKGKRKSRDNSGNTESPKNKKKSKDTLVASEQLTNCKEIENSKIESDLNEAITSKRSARRVLLRSDSTNNNAVPGCSKINDISDDKQNSNSKVQRGQGHEISDEDLDENVVTFKADKSASTKPQKGVRKNSNTINSQNEIDNLTKKHDGVQLDVNPSDDDLDDVSGSESESGQATSSSEIARTSSESEQDEESATTPAVTPVKRQKQRRRSRSRSVYSRRSRGKGSKQLKVYRLIDELLREDEGRSRRSRKRRRSRRSSTDMSSVSRSRSRSRVRRSRGRKIHKGMKYRGKHSDNPVNNIPSSYTPQSCSDAVRDNVTQSIKSPSDTTWYKPALKKVVETKQSNDLLNKITNFVESIRLETSQPEDRLSTSGEDRRSSRREYYDEDRNVDQIVREESAREVADRTILEAEKFKAEIAPPQGIVQPESIVTTSNLIHEMVTKQDLESLLRKLDTDDDFFHVTCHVEQSLKQKIEKGEFVELEKSLPKDKGADPFGYEDSNLLKVVSKEGHTYLTPAGSSREHSSINGIRKWEQAFRVYSAIYSEANPSRAAEIWQYVHVINTAASSYHWNNIAYYDNTFRRLMAKKPWRSWSKVYTQGWNLAMKDPISNSKVNKFQAPGAVKTRDWRDDCCWRFNKSKCSKTNNECKYDHRCKYCGGWGHGDSVCRKKKDKKGYKPIDKSPSSSQSRKSDNK